MLDIHLIRASIDRRFRPKFDPPPMFEAPIPSARTYFALVDNHEVGRPRPQERRRQGNNLCQVERGGDEAANGNGSAHRYIWLLPVACVASLPPSSPVTWETSDDEEKSERAGKGRKRK